MIFFFFFTLKQICLPFKKQLSEFANLGPYTIISPPNTKNQGILSYQFSDDFQVPSSTPLAA